jgi:hypothetical protein
MEKGDKQHIHHIVPDVLQVLGEYEKIPNQYKQTLGSFFVVSSIIVFVLLFLQFYFTDLNAKFLAPLQDATADKFCTTVDVSITGTYMASSKGVWEGNGAFTARDGMYKLTVKNLIISMEDYETAMWSTFDSILLLGEKARRSSMPENLLSWMSYTTLPFGSSAQRFSSIGTPTKVLARSNIMAAIGSVDSMCLLEPDVKFDVNNGVIWTTYDTEAYYNDSQCIGTLDPVLFNSFPFSKFSLQLDTRSMITALAVNKGIISISMLEIIVDPKDVDPIEYNGSYFSGSAFFDPRYPGMKPITCLWLGDVTHPTFELCSMFIGNVYAFPVFEHAGFDIDSLSECTCEEEVLTDPFKMYMCNQFTITTGTTAVHILY